MQKTAVQGLRLLYKSDNEDDYLFGASLAVAISDALMNRNDEI